MKGIKGKKKEQNDAGSRGKLWIRAILAAFAAALVMYLVLLEIEKNMLRDYEKQEILIAAAKIPEGQLLTSENVDRFLKTSEVPKDLVPETAIVSKEQVAHLVARYGIEPGVLLTSEMFRETEKILEGMEHPVIAGFCTEDLYQAAGGILRAGDTIQIYSTAEDGETKLIWEDVFVQQVFDNAGANIQNDDASSAAQRINIYLDKSDVEAFYTYLAQGSLRVVRDWK